MIKQRSFIQTLKIMKVSNNTPTFILSFDSGHKGTRYIDPLNSETGTSNSENAKTFDSREEAQAYNDANKYICNVKELALCDQKEETVFVVSDNSENHFSTSLEEAEYDFEGIIDYYKEKKISGTIYLFEIPKQLTDELSDNDHFLLCLDNKSANEIKKHNV